MKISTRGRYGLRLLIDVAQNRGDSPVTLREIAERQNISEPYLEQVAIALRRAGYIRSVKGAGGGYLCALPAADVRVGDVLRLLEGDMSVVDAPIPGADESPYRATLREALYEPLDRTIAEVLDRKTLADLLYGSSAGYGDYCI
ncbi:MAG: Rrf2 family transcriptional regulator [Fibrobacterales bacterium]|nr:Rrf2 family transcriptional regulator [Fibrobacterales bacterium]